MHRLSLSRPLVFFDLETTGVDPLSDRIVEISVLRLAPGGHREERTRRVNPERPIPPEATAVHGIRDEDVARAPTFRQIARSLMDFLADADLAGFNVHRFDVPLLDREFRDCGLDLGLDRRVVIDAMTIFHRKEPRDLSAAVRFYLGREHACAHDARGDVEATAAVLEAQLERYPELPHTVEELGGWCAPPPRPDAVDPAGKLVWREGRAVFSFGRYQGRALEEVARESPEYLQWIARADFPAEIKEVVARALDGEFPTRSRNE